MTPAKARDLAIGHALHCRADIVNAKDRFEHIRLTVLAEEAEALAAALTQLVPLENNFLPDLPTHI